MNTPNERNNQPEIPAWLWPALSEELQALALIHRQEASNDLLKFLEGVRFPQRTSLNLVSDEAKAGAELLGEALRELPTPLSQEQSDELAADYAGIYLNHSFRASPYESVWLTDEQITQQEPMFEVREWYVKYGLAVPDWRLTPDDHISFQLEFLAKLLSHSPESPISAVAEFMDQHLLRWVGEFGKRVGARCATPFYAGAALLTAGYCDVLRDVLAIALDTPRPAPQDLESLRIQVEDSEELSQPYIPGTEPSW